MTKYERRLQQIKEEGDRMAAFYAASDDELLLIAEIKPIEIIDDKQGELWP